MPAAPQPRMHGITHVPGGSDPIPGLQLSPSAGFFEAMMDVAATRDLRGYWRLGDGGGGPYADSSGRPTPVPMLAAGTGTAVTDLDEGALAAVYDDGAVQFNPDPDDGTAAEYLEGQETWASMAANPFEISVGTVAGWVRTGFNTDPFTAGFSGSVFSMLATVSGGPHGYVLGVEWPAGGITDGVPFIQSQTAKVYGPLLEAGTWVFLSAVCDVTSLRLYINGARVASGTAVSWIPATNGKPKIGLYMHGFPAQGTLIGACDEVSVWADPLTDDEIQALAAAGGIADDPAFRSVVNTDAAYTPHPGETVLADGTFTVTLPTAAGNLGAEITVKNVSAAGTITVAQTGSETIDGSTTDITLTTQQARLFVSDGAGWHQCGTFP